MKKLLLFSVFVFQSIFSFSQIEDSYLGTSLEEYNYVTKGYAVQVDQGLDMKSGYELIDLGSFGINAGEEGEITVEIKELYNYSKSPSLRAKMLILNNSIYDYKIYLCLPSLYSNQELWGKFFDEIKFFSKNYLLATTWALSKTQEEISFENIYPNSILDRSEFGTTLKEYNYVTKGYATQFDQGLDILPGYELSVLLPVYRVDTGDDGVINVEFKDLYKDLYVDSTGNNWSVKRATMLIINNSQFEYKQYLCIPNSRIYTNSDLWDKYFDEIKYLNKNYLLTLTWGLSHYLML